MKNTRECYEGSLKRLKHYLEDSINSTHCADADACHAGLDAISKMEDAIKAGERPWESYDYDEDTQDPDPDEALTKLVEGDKYPITLKRGYPGPEDEPPANIHDLIQDEVGVESDGEERLKKVVMLDGRGDPLSSCELQGFTPYKVIIVGDTAYLYEISLVPIHNHLSLACKITRDDLSQVTGAGSFRTSFLGIARLDASDYYSGSLMDKEGTSFMSDQQFRDLFRLLGIREE